MKSILRQFAVTFLVTTTLFGVSAQAGDGEKVRSASALLTRPSSVKAHDATYREFFAGQDRYIEAEFRNRWQLPSNRTGLGHRNAYDASSSQSSEEILTQRQEFASLVMRVRLESAFNQYMATRDKSSSLRKAHSAVTSLKSQKVTVAAAKGEKSTPWEFQYGYNFFTDYSRFEIVKGSFRVGLHHDAFLADLTGPSERGPRLNASTSLGINAPVAWVGHALGTNTVQAGLTKQLTPSVHGQVYSYQPTADGGTELYGAQLSYTF